MQSSISMRQLSGEVSGLKNYNLHLKDFYLVTDSTLSRHGTIHDVEMALKAGCGIVQYREKTKSTRRMIEEARAIQALCKGRAVFLVNDRIDVALAVDADGVHIGQDDMPIDDARRLLGRDKLIGLTVHDDEEARQAQLHDANYVGLSPIFATSTKGDAGTACGVEMLKRVRRAITIPIVAIGGITSDTVADVIRAGADMVVAISAVLCADDVQVAVNKMRRLILETRPPR